MPQDPEPYPAPGPSGPQRVSVKRKMVPARTCACAAARSGEIDLTDEQLDQQGNLKQAQGSSSDYAEEAIESSSQKGSGRCARGWQLEWCAGEADGGCEQQDVLRCELHPVQAFKIGNVSAMMRPDCKAMCPYG